MAALATTALPLKATSTSMRRIGRQRGPLSRRVLAQGGTRPAELNWVARLYTASSASFVAQPSLAIAGFDAVRLRMAQPTAVRSFADVTEPVVANMRGRPSFQIAAEGQPVTVTVILGLPQMADSATARRFRAAARAHLAAINPGRLSLPVAPPPPIAMSEVCTGLLAHIEPRRTLVALAQAVVSTGAGATPGTNTGVVPIDTIAYAPKFRQPMYEPLRDLSQELLLPGLEAVLPDHVLGLQTNRRFVEAYMVGLNFEMGRELLWRGFPTDQRGTYFDQFWNADAAPEPRRADIEAIHLWNGKRLGEPGTGPKREQFVLLMRSALLRRYPTAVIYAAKAVRVNVNDPRTPSLKAQDESSPLFRGSMQPDVSFFGFDLTVNQATGKDGTEGYFIVIQEQPTEPRFGVAVGVSFGSGATHARLGSGPPAGVVPHDMKPPDMQWGRNAAHMAGITRRLPVRIAIHASQLISTA
jgi:hypothetical protein